MSEVGIRALKQNASAVVAEAAGGETVTITDHGRPVAVMVPVPAGRLEQLVTGGRARPPRRSVRDLAAPEPGPPLSAALEEDRSADRY
jgi:prevent-host-death family protein